jgi:hypothetical protein
MPFAIDLHKDLVDVPAPIRLGPHLIDALLPDLGREHRAEPVPPEADSLMADLDPALVQQVFDIPQRQGEPDVHHHRQADDLGRRLELAKRVGSAHPETLRSAGSNLKRVSSDKTRDRDRFIVGNDEPC